jgi:hypothetical protein
VGKYLIEHETFHETRAKKIRVEILIMDDSASVLEETESLTGIVTVNVHIKVPTEGQKATTIATDEQSISTTTDEDFIMGEAERATAKA